MTSVKKSFELVPVQVRVVSRLTNMCWVSEWLLFNANSAFLYHGENKLIFNEMMILLCTRPTHLGFYNVNSLKQQPVCRPIQTHYLNSEQTSLCSFSLMLHAWWRSNKYQFYSLWFDPNPWSTALEASTLTNTTPMWLSDN